MSTSSTTICNFWHFWRSNLQPGFILYTGCETTYKCPYSEPRSAASQTNMIKLSNIQRLPDMINKHVWKEKIPNMNNSHLCSKREKLKAKCIHSTLIIYIPRSHPNLRPIRCTYVYPLSSFTFINHILKPSPIRCMHTYIHT